MLKLIPQEEPASHVAKTRHRVKKTLLKKKPKTLGQRIHAVVEIEISSQKKLIANVSDKLKSLISNFEKATENELSDIIHSMQKTIISLDKQKRKITMKSFKRPSKS